MVRGALCLAAVGLVLGAVAHVPAESEKERAAVSAACNGLSMCGVM
jgi:hypothetical protein